MENNASNALSITALFAQPREADSAYQSLLESGISKDNINLFRKSNGYNIYIHYGSDTGQPA